MDINFFLTETPLSGIKEKITLAHNKNNLSLTAFLELSGVKRTSYDNLVKKESCNISTLNKIAIAAKVPIVWLFNLNYIEYQLKYFKKMPGMSNLNFNNVGDGAIQQENNDLRKEIEQLKSINSMQQKIVTLLEEQVKYGK